MAYPDVPSGIVQHSEPGQSNYRALVQTAYDKKAHYEYLNKFFLKKLVGADGSGAPIIKKDNFKKTAGDTIRMYMVPQIGGYGIAGDLTLIQNEAAIVPYYVDVSINQLRQAVRTKGKMSQQRGYWNILDDAKPLLTDWAAGIMEKAFFRTVVNGAPGHVQCSTTYGGLNWNSAAPKPPYYWFATGGNDPTYSATDATYVNNIEAAELALEDVETDWLKPADISFLAYKARSLNIPTANIMGVKGYVMLIAPEQTYQLRKHATWLAAQQNAGPRDDKGNQIFAGVGADGYVTTYDGVHVFESNEVLNSVPASMHTDDTQIDDANDTSVKRAVFMGANAVAFVEAKDPTFEREGVDVNNQQIVAIELMFGMGRTDYKIDNSTTIYARNLAVLSTMSPAVTNS